MMRLAPIVLFVYNRIWHIHQCIKALQKNELALKSDLIIYSDGPKDESDLYAVQDVRKYIWNIDGFKSRVIIEKDENFGLANSIISGVTEVVNKYGRIIVLEDDLVCSPYFLSYMNDALNYYENDERVISIHGYTYPVKKTLPETYFMKGADCWGWGTWKRGWNLLETDAEKLLAELEGRKLSERFDMDGNYNYRDMLEKQILGKPDSWAILWHASAFLKDKLTLCPGKSLVHNIGTDGSGEHCSPTTDFDSLLADKPIRIGGIDVVENEKSFKAIAEFFRERRMTRGSTYFQNIMRTFVKFFKNKNGLINAITILILLKFTY